MSGIPRRISHAVIRDSRVENGCISDRDCKTSATGQLFSSLHQFKLLFREIGLANCLVCLGQAFAYTWTQ